MQTFFFDLRSFFTFRLCLGLIIITDGLFRLNCCEEFLTARGAIPIDAIVESSIHSNGKWSILFLSPSSWLQFGFIAMFCFLGLLLASGRHVLSVSVAAWVFHVSILSRAPSITNGGDTLLKLLLFWNALICLEQRCLNNNRLPSDWRIHGFAVTGMILQVCVLYWFTAILKCHPVWRIEFSAVEQSLRIGSLVTPLGSWIGRFPTLCSLATRGTLLLEELGPLLVLLSVRHWRVRLFSVCLFLVFHLLLLAPMMRLGLFPFVCAVAWLAFIPTEAWEWLGARFPYTMDIFNYHAKCYFPARTQTHEPTRRALLTTTRILVAFSIFYVLAWNIVSILPKQRTAWFNRFIQYPGVVLGLRQRWTLFAARPSLLDGWMIAAATLHSGRNVDLITGDAPVYNESMSKVANHYPNFRWRKHLVGLFLTNKPALAKALHEHLVLKWNASHTDEVESMKLFFRYREVLHPESAIRQTEIYPAWSPPRSTESGEIEYDFEEDISPIELN